MGVLACAQVLSKRAKKSTPRLECNCRMKAAIIGDSLVDNLVESPAWAVVKRNFGAIKVRQMQLNVQL